MNEATAIERRGAVTTVLRLEITTIVWMVIEAAVATAARIAARSLLLVICAHSFESVVKQS